MKFRSLQLYSQAIGRIPRLDPHEEQSLARQYRVSGNQRAADRLVRANLRFVVKIALEYRSCGAEMADLIQEGNIGLVKAVQRFDPEKGMRLISYAVWWIRAQILNHVIRSYSLVRLGTTQAQRKIFFSLSRARRDLEIALQGRGPEREAIGPAEIARSLGVKPREVNEMVLRLEERDVSLDAPRSLAGTGRRLDALGCDRVSQDEELSRAREHAAVQKHVGEAFAKLDDRERRVVEMRLMSDEPRSLREMGERLGLSSERARQLEARAKRKLRRHLQPLAAELEWSGTGPASRGGRRSPPEPRSHRAVRSLSAR